MKATILIGISFFLLSGTAQAKQVATSPEAAEFTPALPEVGYRLQEGKSYLLYTRLLQETSSDANELQSNASLELSSRLICTSLGRNPKGNYLLDCSYDDLKLSFFSPLGDRMLSSKDRAFRSIRTYLDELENHTFTMELSPQGVPVDIDGLDANINVFFHRPDFDPKKDDLALKTIKEAFGEEALMGLFAIVMQIYPDSIAETYSRNSTINFNARALDISNTFFLQQADQGNLRIQGVGVIEETSQEMEMNEMRVETAIKGNQTYDILCDGETGWVIEGISKQRIYSLSTIHGAEELPDGLKIPSITESEYIFEGKELHEQ